VGCERKQGVIYTLPGLLTSPVPNQRGSEASGSGRFRVGRSVWKGRYKRSVSAFEDGTDTAFRNVGQLQIDAGEIPKRTFSNSSVVSTETERQKQTFSSGKVVLLQLEGSCNAQSE